MSGFIFSLFTKMQEGFAVDNIWSLDLSARKRGTWWWWYWLFFYEENGEAKQFMVSFSTKDEKKISCEALLIDNHEINVGEGQTCFGGATISWTRDGSRVNPIHILEKNTFTLDSRQKQLKAEGNQKRCMRQEKNGFTVEVDDLGFEVKLKEDSFLKPTYVKNRFPLGFDYRKTSIYKADLTVRRQGKEVGEGSAYFQKVMVNAPIPPWRWGVFHFKKHTLTYYMPFLGSAMLEGYLVKKDAIDFKIPLKAYIKLFDEEKDELHTYDKILVEKTRQGFKLKGEGNDKLLEAQINVGPEIVWNIRKPHKILDARIKYISYPAKIKKIRLEPTNDDPGEGIGVVEAPQGFLI